MGYVYILRLRNGNDRFYVGSTKRNLEDRISEHLSGVSRYTSKFRKKELVFSLEVDNEFVRYVELYFKKKRFLVYEIVKKKLDYQWSKFLYEMEKRKINIRDWRWYI